jgi:hypothetical protein
LSSGKYFRKVGRSKDALVGVGRQCGGVAGEHLRRGGTEVEGVLLGGKPELGVDGGLGRFDKSVSAIIYEQNLTRIKYKF